MDMASMLARDTNEQMERRWRNARDIWLREPDSARGQTAAQMLDLLDEERARRSLPGAIAAFLESFPLGFQDTKFLKEERNDKVAASELALSLLTPAAFKNAEGTGPKLLINDIKRVINETNLIQGSFEKPKFIDALQDPKNSAALLTELCLLLHGDGDAPTRLEAFSDYLHSLGLRKWTYGTYFLFLVDPGNCIYVKPESLKKAAEKAIFDIGYDPAPTAKGYRRILEFARWIEARLRQEDLPELAPRDLIDIQSFAWFIAPTGKFAKE